MSTDKCIPDKHLEILEDSFDIARYAIKKMYIDKQGLTFEINPKLFIMKANSIFLMMCKSISEQVDARNKQKKCLEMLYAEYKKMIPSVKELFEDEIEDL